MEKQKNTTLQIYGVFMLSIILNFVPSALISSFGGLLLLFVIIAIYIYLKKSEKGSVLNTHMSFLIKSFWVSTLLIGIGMCLALFFGDHTIINNAVDGLRAGNVPTEEYINSTLINYGRANMLIFSFTLLPGALYLIYRTVKGFIWATKGQAVNNLKSWF